MFCCNFAKYEGRLYYDIMKFGTFIGGLFLMILILSLGYSYAESEVPHWIKNNAKWWRNIGN